MTTRQFVTLMQMASVVFMIFIWYFMREAGLWATIHTFMTGTH